MYGAYRRVVAKAEVHGWEVVEYKDSVSDLVSPFYVEGEKVEEAKGGEHRALVLSFSLKPSCYATMFLREVMREGRDLGEAEKEEDALAENEELPAE